MSDGASSAASEVGASREGPAPAARMHLTPDKPYPGPASFEERDAAFFFGRTRESAELFSRVDRQALTVLYGKSGLGKTSLLQAGLFPRLRRGGYVPVVVRFTFPGEKNPHTPSLLAQVRAVVSAAIERGALEGAAPAEGESLWLYFRSTSFWDAEGDPVVPALILDQFEEVFTLGGSVREQLDELVTELSDLVEDRIPTPLRRALESKEAGVKLPPKRDRAPAKVLIALREDFLADLERLSSKVPSLGTAAARMSLGPLGYDAAMEAVVEPARARSLVTREVADALVRAAAKAPDTPAAEISVESALLALYCIELNEKRIATNQRAITLELVLANKTIILDGFYERCLDPIPPKKRPLIQRLVEEKLLIGGRRHVYPVASLGEIEDGNVSLNEEDVRPLIDKRLLRKEPRLGEDYLEIIHDVLNDPIDRRRQVRKAGELQSLWLRRVLYGFGVFALVGGGAAIIQDARAKVEQEAEKKRLEATVEKFTAAAASFDTLVWRAMSESQVTDAARAMAAEYRALRAARESYDEASLKHIQLDVPEPRPSSQLALISNRVRAIIGDGRVLTSDPAGLGAFHMSEVGTTGAIVLGNGRSVRLFALNKEKAWDAQPAGRWPEPRDTAPLAKPAEAIDWFSRRIRAIVVSGDGTRAFAAGEKGDVVVWNVEDGRRITGFRTDLQDAELQVDWTGVRALVWSKEQSRALVVSLAASGADVPAGAPLPVAALDLDAKDPPELAKGASPRGNKAQAAFAWTALELTQDGKRIIGTSRDSLEHAGSLVQVWDLTAESAKRTLHVYDRNYGNDRIAASFDGSVVAASNLASLYICDLTKGDFHCSDKLAESLGDSPDLRMRFAHPRRTLLVAGRSLSAFDAADPSAPKKLFDVPWTARSAGLAADDRAVFLNVGSVVMKIGALDARIQDRVRVIDYNGTSASPEPIVRLGAGGAPVWVTGHELHTRSFEAKASRDSYLWYGMAERKDLGYASAGQQIMSLAREKDRLLVGHDRTATYVRLADNVSTTSKWTGALKSLQMASGQLVLLTDSNDLYVGPVEEAFKNEDNDLLKGNKALKKVAGGPGPAAAAPLLAVSPDGAWAAEAAGSRVWVWDRDGRPAWTADVAGSGGPPGAQITAIAVDAGEKGEARALLGDGTGRVIAVRKGLSGQGAAVKVFDRSPHGRAVRALAIGTGGEVASGAQDGTVALWDKDGRLLSRPGEDGPRHSGAVQELIFVQGGALLVSASEDGAARVWEAAGGGVRCTMREHSGPVRFMQRESAEADRVLTVDQNKVAIAWRARSCAVRSNAAESKDHLIVSFFQGRMLYYDRAAGQITRIVPSDDAQKTGPQGDVRWGALTSDRQLVAGDETGNAFAWKSLHSADSPVAQAGTMLSTPFLARAGARLLAVTPEGDLTIFAPPSPAVSARLPMEADWLVRGVAPSGDGASLFVLESGNGALRARRLSGGQYESVSSITPLDRGKGCDPARGRDPDPLAAVAALENASGATEPVALALDDNGCLRMWSEQGKLLLEESLEINERPVSLGLSRSEWPRGHVEFALRQSAKRVPEAKLAPPVSPAHDLVVGLADGAVAFWHVVNEADGATWHSIPRGLDKARHDAAVRQIVFHPGRQFAATIDTRGRAWLWNAAEAHALIKLDLNGPVYCAAFSASGDRLIAGGEAGDIRAFDTSNETDPRETLAALTRWMPELEMTAPAP